MYIEFTLPRGASGVAASTALYFIKQDLNYWTQQYNIPYTVKVVKFTLRVFLPDAESYTMFGLTWDHIRSDSHSTYNWHFVDPMIPPNKID